MSNFFGKETGDICRGGGNGPFHPSQIMGLDLIKQGESLLDIGCGSATTTECIDTGYDHISKYKGVDFIDHRIGWCKLKFPGYEFEQQDAMHLKEEDKSWDVVWSRHVVDHLPSFEEAIDEQLRVAKKRVICILWYSFSYGVEHDIKHIKGYDEYLNSYSISKVLPFLCNKYKDGWVFDIYFKVGLKDHGQDCIIHIYRSEERLEV